MDVEKDISLESLKRFTRASVIHTCHIWQNLDNIKTAHVSVANDTVLV